MRPYLESSEFDPEFIRSKSFAAAGLCAWVINIVKFYEVFCDVEPKRKALAAANAELKAAQERLAKIKAKIKVRSIQSTEKFVSKFRISRKSLPWEYN